jgi:crotonobetainyl-CoA:carnitine CoA-transferase CaiB-like acyl-CoA transferase
VSDVVVENWRPGVADRLGVGYTAVAALNPRVVYCSISGFGQQGPYAQRPAYAPIVHSASGYDLAQVEYQGHGSGARPANTATFTADVFGGMSAFAAIQTALYNRERSGAGQYIDVALLDCMLNILVAECQEAQAPAGIKPRVYSPLKARDGYVVVAPTSQNNFAQLARVLGHPEWLVDPRFAASGKRERHWAELMVLIEGWAGQRTVEECEKLLLAGGVPCGRYRTVAEALADPQLRARGAITQIEDDSGAYWVPNAPFQMPGLNMAPRPNVPKLGESSEELLTGLLGYSRERAAACTGARAAMAAQD